MDSVKDDAKGVGYRRVEVLTGPGRRRSWSDDEKARIVAETAEPGAKVTEVARRWQVSPQQVFDWRRQARRALVSATTTAEPSFVPVVAEPPDPAPEATAAPVRQPSSLSASPDACTSLAPDDSSIVETEWDIIFAIRGSET